MSTESKVELKGEELLTLCCQTLANAKAENIVALDVRETSSITNYLVLASGLAEPHLKALRRELDKALKDHKVKILGVDEGDFSGWAVVDAFDIMVHLFSEETRETYKLEALWKDAIPVDVEKLLEGK
ncbi:ribosome silencing factor [Pelagicoccus sp. NFK12]|uniref:Ribosomal silencing factor RsfS n=1 Tax=Pelagicoccus enzymogenes TaxID=2773457 RepID=A0A927F529_9BACT|nr:ribosome silencing factor [Pelagicoccus enzymogenes]MBD5778523.1 ribosome silencing factor [Pelagicoccus enzymogenes]MDQ8197115.1 ribosome silencing factor [Pelagicoccus enzymogenes]